MWGGVVLTIGSFFIEKNRLSRWISMLKISGENSLIDRSYTDNLSSMRDLSLQTNLLLNRDQTPNKELDLL